MYHSVGRHLEDWAWARTLTIAASVFEDHLRWLRQSGYRTVGLDALRAHVAGEETLDDRSVVLTFDDGYVDNWTYVFPLLRKYDMTGTVLVTTDFVDPRDVVRPTLADVWNGRTTEAELEVRGFLSWPELNAAAEHGVLSVECHAKTHTWYPSGPKVIDFHFPDDARYWMDWNAHPETKPFYLRAPNESRVPWGTPVYEHAQSLTTTRYFPPEEETAALTAHVADNGGARFFSRPRWREELFEVLEAVRRGGTTGRFETAEERAVRWAQEIDGSRTTIEQKTGSPVDFLVWPTHAYNAESLALARERYKATTIAREDAGAMRNRPGDDPRSIVRMGVPLIPLGEGMLAPGGRYFVASIEEFAGNVIARARRMVLKRCYKARAMTRR